MRLRTGLLAAFAYVLLLAIVALGVPLALSLSARVNDEVRSQAQGQADLVAASAADLLSGARRGELAVLARGSAAAVRGRVLIVNGSGIVLADSAVPPELGSSYAARPEIASALRGHQVQVQRPSQTLGEEILATAVPIIRNRATVGAVRVTQSVAAVHAAINRVELGLALIGAIVLALGLAVGVVIARQVARPLGRLEQVAMRVAGGDLSARAAIEGSREQRSLGTSFNEMADRVERLLGSQRAFVADASHQLRTPLTGLRLRIEEARAGDVSAAAASELDAGIAEVDRLAQIVEELLVLSRAGERELPGESLDLRVVVERALSRWRSAAAKREIELEAQERNEGEAWCASVDADRALDVLVENAVRYAPRGSRVTLSSAPGRIEVRDRGPGLAPGEEDSIFERFHRGSAGVGTPGSGLGLAIARELAREWGGEVTLHNREGGGTVATLTLPAPNPARDTVGA
ncbi:MAG TPA: HAMP domain-containing sensor histidine kinase [Solirubrobacteraceae bacterium]|nr:HAMP domain-containing sensor histidine kinase [Solirubrobacteraceae bacterium]